MAMATATAGISQRAQPGRLPASPSQSPSAPNTKARSLLPIGPSYWRGLPTIGPRAPAISEIAERKMTAPTLPQPKGATTTKGR